MGSYQTDQNVSAQTETLEFDALLIDMDGTIIDSTAAIVKFWHQFGKEIGVDGDEILKTSHGRRTIDILGDIAPDRANWEYINGVEASIPRDHGKSAVEIPGSRALLQQLDSLHGPWAIVTSGTRGLVHGWLEVMKLSKPRTMVTAEEVTAGKPDPACYLLGAQRVLATKTASEAERDASAARMLVIEDAPAGVRAGKAAGFKVLGLATTHDVEKVWQAGADWVVTDLRSVSITSVDEKTGKVTLEIRNRLVRA